MIVNFRKTALAVIALSFGGVASAAMYAPPPAAEPMAPDAKSGFYVGIGGGAMDFFTEFSGPGTSTSEDGLVTISQNSSSDSGSLGWNTTAEVGYAWALPNRFFLGIEAFGNYTNTATSTTSSSSTTIEESTDTADTYGQLKMDWIYGIRALPGYQVTPSTTVYGIIGYARAHADLNTAAESVTSEGVVQNLPTTTESFNFNGLQLGLGSMIDVTEHVAIRGDIIYTDYQDKTSNTLDTDSRGGTYSSSTQLSPSTLEANVGVVYKFD